MRNSLNSRMAILTARELSVSHPKASSIIGPIGVDGKRLRTVYQTREKLQQRKRMETLISVIKRWKQTFADTSDVNT